MKLEAIDPELAPIEDGISTLIPMIDSIMNPDILIRARLSNCCQVDITNSQITAFGSSLDCVTKVVCLWLFLART